MKVDFTQLCWLEITPSSSRRASARSMKALASATVASAATSGAAQSARIQRTHRFMRSRSQLFRIALMGGLVSMALAAQDDAWDALLKKCVTSESRVNYAAWKAKDSATLEAYAGSLARMSEPFGKAELINAYNAFTIQWILR